ncbi:hypothetical protein [Methylobacterium sp. GC_Met_2]|uniref:hypothetical protein n=1 Tax=Methylobacterium sp. GC_Met_2 TaxID=2937376 RepID=UPI00226B27B8|nr:hypothetical protein [Methylobacterium sp. GC_Met_2]
MTARPPDSDDYAAGYADGVRDAAAWTTERVARLLSAPTEELLTAIRQLHRDAGTRWAKWADRRNWPDVRARVARARGRGEEG